MKDASRSLYFTYYFRRNDAATLTTVEILRMLEKLKIDTTVLTADPKMKLNKEIFDSMCKEHNLQLHRIRLVHKDIKSNFIRASIGWINLYMNSLNIIKCKKIDFSISQAHIFHFVPLSSLLLKLSKKIPTIIKVHDIFASRSRPLESSIEWTLNFRLYKRVFRYADSVFVQSMEMKKNLIKNGFMPYNLVIFPNTVSLSFRSTGKKMFKVYKNDFLEKHPILERDNIKLLYAGKLYKDRGAHYLIKPLKKASKKMDISLIIAGKSVDVDLNSLLNKTGLKDEVIFVGELPHRVMPIIIQLSDLCVGPLRADIHTVGAVPRKLLEYFLFEKTAIAAEGSATKKLVNCNTCILINNPADLEHVLIHLDEFNLRKLGKNAFEAVKESFLSEKYVKILKKILEKISDRRRENH